MFLIAGAGVGTAFTLNAFVLSGVAGDCSMETAATALTLASGNTRQCHMRGLSLRAELARSGLFAATLHGRLQRWAGPFMAMEMIEGQTQKHRLSGNPLPLEQLLELGTQIADALDAAQARTVHRGARAGLGSAPHTA